MILIIASESPEEIRDVGILEEKMSHYEKAIEFIKSYIKLQTNAEDADFILEFIRKIREKINHQ